MRNEQLEEQDIFAKPTTNISSGDMEVTVAEPVCSRSEQKLEVRYTKYLWDGDSKGLSAILDKKPYGNDVLQEKLEYVRPV